MRVWKANESEGSCLECNKYPAIAANIGGMIMRVCPEHAVALAASLESLAGELLEGKVHDAIMWTKEDVPMWQCPVCHYMNETEECPRECIECSAKLQPKRLKP